MLPVISAYSQSSGEFPHIVRNNRSLNTSHSAWQAKRHFKYRSYLTRGSLWTDESVDVNQIGYVSRSKPRKEKTNWIWSHPNGEQGQEMSRFWEIRTILYLHTQVLDCRITVTGGWIYTSYTWSVVPPNQSELQFNLLWLGFEQGGTILPHPQPPSISQRVGNSWKALEVT